MSQWSKTAYNLCWRLLGLQIAVGTLNTQCLYAQMQPTLDKMIALTNMPIVHSNDMKSPWDLTTTYIAFYIMLDII